MTFYLKAMEQEGAAPPVIPEEERPPAESSASFGENFSAAWRAETVRTDAWGYERRQRRDLALEMFGQLPDDAKRRIGDRQFDHENSWITFEEMITDEIGQLVARDPGKWGQYPLDREQFDAEIDRRRRAEIDEAERVLALPGGGFAEFLGAGARAITDQTSLALAPFGFSGAPLRFIAGEAALGAAGEAAVLPREYQVAEELGLPEPNAGGRILTGAIFGGGLAASIVGIGRAARYLQTRHEARTAGRPADVDSLDHQARIAVAEARLRDEITVPEATRPPPDEPLGRPLRMGDFDFSRSGNASPRTNRIGYVFGKLLELGYEPHIAAAIVGNFMVESGPGLNTRAVGDGGNAFGMGQWNGPRRRQYLAFAARRGAAPDDLDTQIAFLDWELKNTEAGNFARVLEAPDAAAAAAIFSNEVWRPGIPHLDRRVGFARQIMDQFDTGAVPKWSGRTPAPSDDMPIFSRTSRGFTGEGQIRINDELRIDVDYEVVDASILRQASGDLQPRDRSRINSDAWVAETAAGLDPALLRPAPTADRGAPIVGPDGVIESGNGRVRAIERAYERFPDRAAAYRAMIEAETGQPIPDGIERPVLVARRRTTLDDTQRQQLVRDAQDSGVARMTPTEISEVTGRAMTSDTLALLQPAARLGDAENAPFVKRALGRLPASERNALFDATGALNAEGSRRLRQALFARAWPDRQLIGRYAELEDAGPLKSLLAALERAAPEWAALRSDIEAGLVRPEFDISPFVVDAMRLIAGAREAAARGDGPIAGILEELLAEVDLLEGALPDVTVALVRKFFPGGRAASADDIAAFLSDYARRARDVGQPSMLGDDVGAAELLRSIDGETFAAVTAIPARAPDEVEAPTGDLAPEAYADGAISPEAELADAAALEALQAPRGVPEAIAQDPEVIAALDRMAAVPRTDLQDGFGTDEWWAGRQYVARGENLLGKEAAVDYLFRAARGLAWTDEGLAPPSEISAGRQATILIGAPAAGKSTVANPWARSRSAAIVDADEAKKIIPEYRGGIGAGAVHEESSELAEEVLARVLEDGLNVVLPKVGGSPGSIERLAATLREFGYRIEVVHVDVPADEAWRRMIGRFRATGRIIPPEVMAKGIDGPGATYQVLKEKGTADDYFQIDNSPGLGEPRRLVEGDEQKWPPELPRDGGDGDAGARAGVRAPEGQEGGRVPDRQELDAAAAALADDFDITLPDGTTWRASELLSDVQEDLDLADVIELCKIGGPGA